MTTALSHAPRAGATSAYSGAKYRGTRSYAIPGRRQGGGDPIIRANVISWAQNFQHDISAINDSMGLGQVRSHSDTLLLAEYQIAANNLSEFTPGISWTQMVQPELLATRHQGKSAAVLCDGHVQMIDAAGSVGTGSIGAPYYTSKGMWTVVGGD